MSLSDWIQNTAERIRREGISGALESSRFLYSGVWRIGCSRLPIGKNVYTRDWDVLVLLDGCRVDLLREVANEYAFLGRIDSIRSVGSSSREWLAKTFTPQYREFVTSTAYITANPYTADILTPGGAEENPSPFNPVNWDCLNTTDFQFVEEVWRGGWDDDLGTVPPRHLTDRAISIGRKAEPERMILHYMQPHQPFIPALEHKLTSDSEIQHSWIDTNCWNALRRGEVSREEVWVAYRENLRLVLNDLKLLLQNIDAETVVISSDHGNAFGEWGIYGHPNGFLHPTVKRVPWVETTASDSGEYSPTETLDRSIESSVSERLEDLGYL